MTHRTLNFSLSDVAWDYGDVAVAITKACRRLGPGYRVTGVCQTGGTLVLPVTDGDDFRMVRYVLAPMSGDCEASVRADLLERWAAGFVVRGTVRMAESMLGLFEANEII